MPIGPSNLLTKSPIPHANRGRWLELAIEESCRIYQLRGLGKITRHGAPAKTIEGKDGVIRTFRTVGPVDFSGGYRGVPFAMDAKSCADSRLCERHIPSHQLEELLDYEMAPHSTGFLLVVFQERWAFAVTASWWFRTIGRRGSIPLRDFAEGAARLEPGIMAVEMGAAGVPVHFGPAVLALASRPSREQKSE